MLDPEDYLHQVLQRIAEHPVKQIRELLRGTSPTSGRGSISVRLPKTGIIAPSAVSRRQAGPTTRYL